MGAKGTNNTEREWESATILNVAPATGGYTVENGLPVDYQNIKSLSDFVLIQVGWIVSVTGRREFWYNNR